MTAYKCDRCGRLFPTIQDGGLILAAAEPTEDPNVERIQSKDLCPVCQEQLERWFNRTSKNQQKKLRQFETPELNGGFIFK